MTMVASASDLWHDRGEAPASFHSSRRPSPPSPPMPFSDFPVERATFAQVLPDLLAEHRGHFVVIIGTQVLAVVRTLAEALECGFAALGRAGFFIERVTDVPRVMPFLSRSAA